MPSPKAAGLDESTAVRIPATRAVVAEEVARQLQAITPEQTDFDDDETEVTPIDRLTEMMRETGDGKARVKVYKQNLNSKIFEFCCEYMPEQFEEGGLDMLRRDWGHGSYQLKLYATHPATNKFVIRATQAVTLAQMQSAPVALAAVPHAPSELSQVLAALVEGQNKLLQALTAQPQKSAKEELKETLEIMALMRPPETQKSSISEIVEAVKEIKGMQSLIGGESEKEPSLLGLAPQLLDTIKSFVPPRSAQPQQLETQAFPQLSVPASLNAPSESQPLENPAPLDSAQSQPQQLPEDDPDMLEFLAFAARLKKDVLPLAGNMEKVNDVAELLEAKAPYQFFEVLEMDNWFEALTQYAPQFFPALVPVLANNREWLTAVRARVIELLKE